LFDKEPIYLRLNLDNNLSISKYSHTNVTISVKEAYHSIYFGTELEAAFFMKSRSRIKFIAATPTITKLIMIPTGPKSSINGILLRMSLYIKFSKYAKPMASVASITTTLNFLVGRIIFVAYKVNITKKTHNVKIIACTTIPSI